MGISDLLKEKFSEKVISSKSEDLSLFDVFNPVIEKQVAPTYVARPTSVSELQELVRIANDHRLGLVPVSSVGPHSRGGIRCSKEHMVVDLSSWKKIPFVN